MLNRQLDVILNGLSLVDRGFMSEYNVFSGIGLNTFGALWGAEDIWALNDARVTTVWTRSDASITTVWTNNDASVTTKWSIEFPQ